MVLERYFLGKTKPSDAVKGMELAHSKPIEVEKLENIKGEIVSWGSIDKSKATTEELRDLKDTLVRAPFVLAFWEDSAKLVIASRDPTFEEIEEDLEKKKERI